MKSKEKTTSCRWPESMCFLERENNRLKSRERASEPSTSAPLEGFSNRTPSFGAVDFSDFSMSSCRPASRLACPVHGRPGADAAAREPALPLAGDPRPQALATCVFRAKNPAGYGFVEHHRHHPIGLEGRRERV